MSDGAEAELERGRKLFSRPCRFVVSAVSERDFPPTACPEIALAGRSNAGKSSLLNALTGYRDLARTSRQPGRTQMINFFAVEDRLALVDLPGYGYAKAPKREVADWRSLVERYLTARPNLRRVLVLVDARRGLMESDRTLMAGLTELGMAFQIVLTKADTVKADDLKSVLSNVARQIEDYPAAVPAVIATSARKNRGLDRLRAELAELAGRK